MTTKRLRARARLARDRAKASMRRGKQSIFSRIAKIIFHRTFFVSVGIALQLFILAVPIIWFARYSAPQRIEHGIFLSFSHHLVII